LPRSDLILDNRSVAAEDVSRTAAALALERADEEIGLLNWRRRGVLAASQVGE